ncbi:MAG: efflux RND transporter periplasmic adaptor subunit [Hyphomicrobiaceae bacterium]
MLSASSFTKFGILAALSALLAACGDGKPPAQNTGPPPAPAVTVAKPIQKMVAETDEYVGRFVPADYVEIRARVSGYLDAILFSDGQLVKKGDPLFTIDKRPYQSAFAQAEAARGTAQANLAFAESDMKRGEGLVRGSTITQQSFDQRTQAKRVAEANVMAQDAAIKQAALDLQFTSLTAPISGRIGDRRVSVGNLVAGGTTGTTLLATIASIDPIRFEFTMDEGSYLRVVRNTAPTAANNANLGLSLPVKLKLIDEQSFSQEGKIDFVDNAIDKSSGTIRARAQFANPEGRLTPGMFGRIQIETKPATQALLVPDTAIGTEQVRKFVYAINADNVATPKYVTLGPAVDGLRVVTGLSPDDTIVVNGLMRIRPGAKVTPQQAASPIPPAREQAKAN